MNLSEAVLNKIRGLGIEQAADFFSADVSLVEGWLGGTVAIPISAAEKIFNPDEFVNAVRVKTEKNVCLMLPSYKATNPITMFSVLSDLDRTKMAVMLHFGDAFISHTRNGLACNFLKTNIPWAFTVDDDMVIPCGSPAWFNDITKMNLPEKLAGRSSIQRLLSHGKTLIGGLYYGRWQGGNPVYGEGNQTEEKEWLSRGPHDVIKPTRWVGTGCMLIHRSVFLDIEMKFPHLARNAQGNLGHWFTSSEHDLKEAAKEALEVLGDGAIDESTRIAKARSLIEASQQMSQRNSLLGTGEDVQFCVRAAQAGHQPWVDCGLLCGHIGHYVYGQRFE